jgi:DNA repair photolyase
MDRLVISASRRTDIPAFYLDWFLAGLSRGYFVALNPFNGARRQVSTHPQQVHSIVFWSKDYTRLLERAGELAAYRLFFQFTLNSESPGLEPRLPPLEARLAQFRALAERFGAAAVNWRFDPIVCWEQEGVRRNNLGQFEMILEAAAGAGIRRLTFSFMDRYAKAERRAAAGGLRFYYPGLAEMLELATPLAEAARAYGLRVAACCEPKLREAMPAGLVSRARCVDGPELARLYGPGASLAEDRGQRRSAGCGCTVSVDVGSYSAHPCPHGCLYCYANPAPAAAHLSHRRGEAPRPGAP